MARNKVVVTLVYINERELVFKDIPFKSLDKANIWGYKKVLDDEKIVGCYITENGEMKSPYYVVGIVHLWQDIVRHPNFVPYDHEIFTGKYSKVLLVAGGYIIAPPKDAKLLMRY